MEGSYSGRYVRDPDDEDTLSPVMVPIASPDSSCHSNNNFESDYLEEKVEMERVRPTATQEPQPVHKRPAVPTHPTPKRPRSPTNQVCLFFSSSEKVVNNLKETEQILKGKLFGVTWTV